MTNSLDISARIPWIGVDFDRTLAQYPELDATTNDLGPPIPAMVERVQRWLNDGRVVRVVTARVAPGNSDCHAQAKAIRNWCQEHIGRKLDVTWGKDYAMIELWDDSVVRVERGTGKRLSPSFIEKD